MLKSQTARDWLRIGEAASLLGVTEQTLRNWDASGRLRPRRHPVNGYRLYSAGELRDLVRDSPLSPEAHAAVPAEDDDDQQLAPGHWTPSVALDPKHRPQAWDLPSSTVRRDWRKFPQEAHVIRADGRAYRRLAVAEIAALQSLPADLADVGDYTVRQRIAAIGDAVPPPLARAAGIALRDVGLQGDQGVEICSGVGGMARGIGDAGFRHAAAVEHDPVAAGMMRALQVVEASRIHVADVREFDFEAIADGPAILCGGPPCQPWSQSGLRRGVDDARDLMGWVPELVSRLAPEAFLFENVPGLLAAGNEQYLRTIVEQLRRPGHVRYGVAVALFNAADFGVPQTRRRILVVGLRERSNAAAHAVFDRVASQRTHRGPGQSPGGRERWRTVGEAIGGFADAGGWRRWPA